MARRASAECGWRCALMRIAALCLLAFATPAAAEADYVWRNVVIGGGGFSPNIIFSRTEPRLAYLRTDIGGAYRWDEPGARWIALQDHMADGNLFGIESIALDPSDSDVVYLAAGMYRRDGAAILRSRNRGTSWETFPVDFRMGGNEDGRGLGERLAVDPSLPSRLFFGSRHDGLMVSADSAATWTRVESFPLRGRGAPPPGQPTNAGIAFVLFDAATGQTGTATRTIFVGSADPGEHHLFRSSDAGATWQTIEGGPSSDLLPVRAELGPNGVLYVAYANGMGPNGITGGALYAYDTQTGIWSDISPDPLRAPGGYMGFGIDRQRPGALVVASINRWQPNDTIWRSADHGVTWRDYYAAGGRDVSETPFLNWGEPQADFGWWMAGLAVDPFDGRRIAYTTGATVYATEDITAESPIWRPWVRGVEETAVLTLVSPSEGPQLLSGFGDLSGFAHDDLGASPEHQFVSPVFSNTNTIDVAGQAQNVIVRSGVRAYRTEEGAPTLAYSLDHARTWQVLSLPLQNGQRYDANGDTALTVSADGALFVAMTPTPLVSADRGASWNGARGLPLNARPIADRVLARRLYALNFDTGDFFQSEDGVAYREVRSHGLPRDLRTDRPTHRERPFPLMATPGRAGDLWFVSRNGLFHSTDGGRRFTNVRSDVEVQALGFGHAPPGGDYPALYAIGARGDLVAIWRSDDRGETWIRLNDAQHEYGRRFRCIAGDPRVYGRVYVGTDGRGIVYGEPRT